MMGTGFSWRLGVLLGIAGLQVSCTAISDLGRFKVADGGSSSMGRDAAAAGDASTTNDGGAGSSDGGNSDASVDGGGPKIGCDNPATICVRLKNFDQYKGHLVVVDVATEGEQLRARALLDPAQDAATQDVVLPLAVPADEVPDMTAEHPLHLEIWADTDDDGKYTPMAALVGDPSWLVGLSQKSHAEVDAKSLSVMPLVPQPTPIGKDFSLQLSGFNIHTNRLLEAMVIEHDSGRTVGMYRLLHIPKVDTSMPDTAFFKITLPGIIDPKLSYDIEFYADADGTMGDLKYDGLFDDHSWILMDRMADSTGLHIVREHTVPKDKMDPDAPFRELHYQFPYQD